MVQSHLHLNLTILFSRTKNKPYILAEKPENEITLMFPQDITMYIF